jgi:probable HAF family extracellular repeat protein
MAQSMNDLGTLGGTTSIAYGVSADGKVIVGYSWLSGGSSNTAMKYANGTLTNLGTMGGPTSHAWAASADGSVIVGYSQISAPFTVELAFKYSNGVMTSLGTLGGTQTSSRATGVSADGSVIVGYSFLSGYGLSNNTAFQYSNGVMTSLGTLAGGAASYATGVSADGSVIVGYSYFTGGGGYYHASKYADGTLTDLGTLGGASSQAKAVSADGSVIVGYSQLANTNLVAFKYSNGVMTSLGTLGGTRSYANGVSADGSVIVGYSYLLGATDNIAFKYSNGVMTSLGTLGGASSTANGVSADGKVIVGYAKTASNLTHAFVYGAWANGGLVDADNTYSALATNSYQLNSLLNAQNTALAVNLNSDCTVYGANNVCVGVGGRYTNVSSPTTSQTAGNVQVGYRFAPSFRAGVFLDQGISNTTPNNYTVKNSQPLAGLFAVYSPSGTNLGWQVKASVAYSSNGVNITRTTLSNTEAGQGTAAMTTQGGQLETAYGLALDNGWIASPFAGIRSTRVSRDSYTETAGATFPITYNAVNQSATTAYGGAKVMGYVTSNISVGASVGVEQDMSSNISNNSGSIYYLGAYSLDAPTIRETRAVVAVNADYWIEKNQRISFSAYYNQQSLNTTDGITAMLYYTVGL